MGPVCEFQVRTTVLARVTGVHTWHEARGVVDERGKCAVHCIDPSSLFVQNLEPGLIPSVVAIYSVDPITFQ